MATFKTLPSRMIAKYPRQIATKPVDRRRGQGTGESASPSRTGAVSGDSGPLLAVCSEVKPTHSTSVFDGGKGDGRATRTSSRATCALFFEVVEGELRHSPEFSQRRGSVAQEGRDAAQGSQVWPVHRQHL